MLITVSIVNVKVQHLELTLHFSTIVFSLRQGMAMQLWKGEVDCHHNLRAFLILFCSRVFLYATCMQWLQMVVSYPICILGMELRFFEQVLCALKLWTLSSALVRELFYTWLRVYMTKYILSKVLLWFLFDSLFLICTNDECNHMFKHKDAITIHKYTEYDRQIDIHTYKHTDTHNKTPQCKYYKSSVSIWRSLHLYLFRKKKRFKMRRD